jgi:hypothetical protein
VAWPGIEPGSPASMAVALTSELLTMLVTMNEETTDNFHRYNSEIHAFHKITFVIHEFLLVKQILL